MENKKHQQTTAVPVKARFPLGFIATTPGVEATLSPADIGLAIARHARGDWGDVREGDWEENEDALQAGGRLLSVYRAADSGERFFVITEADRSVTTVLLTTEY